jgi:hypothetical protein
MANRQSATANGHARCVAMKDVGLREEVSQGMKEINLLGIGNKIVAWADSIMA